jgi:hypothetical protein
MAAMAAAVDRMQPPVRRELQPLGLTASPQQRPAMPERAEQTTG